MRAIGVFSDLAYYPSLVALINSTLHFRVQARIKVYDWKGLPHLLRSGLERHAEVVSPPASILGDHYLELVHYRPRFLAAVGIDPYELLLDADTVVLSDLEEAFRAIEAGEVAAVREWEYVHAEMGHEYPELTSGSVFHRLLAYPEAFREGPLPIYNFGLLGLNREAHGPLIELLEEVTHHHDELAGTFFEVDQNGMALVLASLQREGKIALHELPPELWMRTWAGHREPQKLLAFEDGSPALYNGDRSRRMRFYHYTGGIVPPPELLGRDAPIPVRFGHLVSDLALPPEVTQRQMTESWHYVWRRRHETPAGELPGFFYDLGPLRAPRCIDPGWRELLGRFLVRSGIGSQDVGPPDKDSREVWALALAHDYVEHCGYRTGEMGWLAPALEALLGAERLRAGERTIAWEREADVVVGFRSRYREPREWTGGEYAAAAAGYAEHHCGVFLDIA
jgi:hypothetical protein